MATYEISLNFVALVKTGFGLACFRKALKEESEQRPYPTTVRKWLPHDITNPDEGGLYWISVEEHDGWERFQFSSTVNPYATTWILNKVLLPDLGRHINGLGYIAESSEGLFKYLDVKIIEHKEGWQGIRIEFEWLKEKRQFGLLLNYKFFERTTSTEEICRRRIQELSLSYDSQGKSNVNFSVDTYSWEKTFLKKVLSGYEYASGGYITESLRFNSAFSSAIAKTLTPRMYKFGNGGISSSQYSGLMHNGPCESPDDEPTYFFVFRPQDRVVARTLYKCLDGREYKERFPGMENVFHTKFKGDAIRFHELVDFSRQSFEGAAAVIKQTGGLNPVGIVLVDEDPQTYYTQKAVFLEKGIATQNVQLSSVLRRRGFECFVAGIGLQLFCKAKGKPWKVSTRHDDTLIVGISQVWNSPDEEQKRYISYSVSTDASGLFQDIQTLADETTESNYVDSLALSLESKLRKLTECPRKKLKRIVLHCSFKLPFAAMKRIREIVEKIAGTDQGIQIAILRINTDHQYSGYDLSNASLVPRECSFVALGGLKYILWCDGAKDARSLSKRPCSPIHVSFDQSYPKLTETDRMEILEDVSNLAGANWRGFNAATRPVSVFYCRIVGEFIKEFSRRNLPVPSIEEFMPWFL